MASAESIGGWGRQGRDLARRLVALRRRAAAEADGLVLGRRRHLNTGSTGLLDLLVELLLVLVGEHGGHGLLGVGRLGLGSHVVNVVLAGHRVVVDLLSLAHGSLEAELLLHVAELLLLLVDGDLLLSELGVVQVELLELLGSGLDVPKLLLKTLLLLSQVHVGGDELGVEVGVHLLGLLVEGELGRSQDLINSVVLGLHVLLLDTVLGEGTLGDIVGVLLSVAVQGSGDGVPGELLVGGSRGWRVEVEVGSCGGLGGGSQAGKQVRAASAGSGSTVLVGVGSLLDVVEGQRLDVLAATARGQTSRGHGEPVGRSEVVGSSHLSETAGVHFSKEGYFVSW